MLRVGRRGQGGHTFVLPFTAFVLVVLFLGLHHVLVGAAVRAAVILFRVIATPAVRPLVKVDGQVFVGTIAIYRTS